MTLDEYLVEYDKRPTPFVDRTPITLVHTKAKIEILHRVGHLPRDLVLVQKQMELTQDEFNTVVKSLRLLCELEYDSNTGKFCDFHHIAYTSNGKAIEINVYDDGYPRLYGFDEYDPVVCVACYCYDSDLSETDFSRTVASFIVHRDFFKPQKSEAVAKSSKSTSLDMCQAMGQAVVTMEGYLSISEIKDMVLNDQCTLTAEYRPQLTDDLQAIYDSLDDYNKGVLQDRLDDMWIMYCEAFYLLSGFN